MCANGIFSACQQRLDTACRGGNRWTILGDIKRRQAEKQAYLLEISVPIGVPPDMHDVHYMHHIAIKKPFVMHVIAKRTRLKFFLYANGIFLRRSKNEPKTGGGVA